MSGLPFFARALFDYDAVESTELSLTTGDSVVIEEVNESGWSLARAKGTDRVGWIPTEYIEKVDSDGAAVLGQEAEISVERPQPNPLSGSQALGVSTSRDGSQVIAAEPTAASEAEEEVAALRITTTQEPQAQAGAAAAPPSTSAAAPAHAIDAVLAASSLAAALPASPRSPASPSSPAPPPVVSASGKTCAHCHESIKSAFVMARDQLFHPNHFLCATCSLPLGGKPYLEKDGAFYCESDYYAQFNPRCGQCQEVIQGPYVSALGQAFHPHHFTCHHCNKPFPNQHFRAHEERAYCEEHYAALFAPQCHTCHQPVVGAVFEALGFKYHLPCFVCVEGGHQIGEGVMFHMHEGAVYCPEHFEQRFLQVCVQCNKAIKGQYIKGQEALHRCTPLSRCCTHHALSVFVFLPLLLLPPSLPLLSVSAVGESFYHSDCWACARCRVTLRVESCAQHDSHFYCKQCVADIKKEQGQPHTVAAAASVLNSQASSAQQSRAASQAVSPLPAPLRTVVADQPSPIVRPTPAPTSAEVVPLPSPSTSDDADAVKPSAPVAAAYTEPDVTPSVSYDLLKSAESRPKEVDPKRKEQYLSDEEFKRLFGVDKAEFNALPLWKRAEHKKKHGLF